MAMNPGASRRQRELDRQRKQKEKAAKKEQRKLEKREQAAAGEPLPPGVDPDIAGIVPGPQPLPDD